MERFSAEREAFLRRLGRPGEKGMTMSHTILLVDDDEYVLDVTSRLLSVIGCRVIPARDGAEALVKLRENIDQVSLVMLDVSMPRLGGEATAREVRAAAPDMREGESSACFAPRAHAAAHVRARRRPRRRL